MDVLISKDEYIAALAVVRAYERQVELMSDSNINSGVIIAAPEGYWYTEKIGLEIDYRPATYMAIQRTGLEKEDISLYYEVISGPYTGYVVLKDNVRSNHKLQH